MNAKDKLSARLMDAFLGETPSVAWGELLREASIELRTPPAWWDAMHEVEHRLSSAAAEVDCFNVYESLAVVRDIIDDNIPAGRPNEGTPTLDQLLSLLPGAHYMDPPDGGDVPLLEQLRRMANDAMHWRNLRAAIKTESATPPAGA